MNKGWKQMFLLWFWIILFCRNDLTNVLDRHKNNIPVFQTVENVAIIIKIMCLIEWMQERITLYTLNAM